MPLLTDSAYAPPLFLRNGHVQTVYPALLRKIPQLPWQRERIATPDGDFLDLDWLRRHSTNSHMGDASPVAPAPPLVILCHGLEGSSTQGYICGMARALSSNGWDVLAWNFRGCSGTPNLQLRSYHSGATDDLATVIAHAAKTGYVQNTAANAMVAEHPNGYRSIALVGFSLGGNMVLKYLGESAAAAEQRATAKIIGGVAISVPCDLSGSTTVLERRSNRIYMARFLQTLRQKIRDKHHQFPEAIDINGLDGIRTFREFDDRYTAPLHGFKDANHYWHACSCLRVIERINVPTLLINAADDPFLSADCYPAGIAREHPFLHLEIPRHGGHVGFVRHAPDGHYFSEQRACAFLAQALNDGNGSTE